MSSRQSSPKRKWVGWTGVSSEFPDNADGWSEAGGDRTQADVPRVHAGVLRRTRLLEMLDDHGASALTVLDAAVGYGKTTLVRSWCIERPEPVLWMTLDSADDDPVRLWLATGVDRGTYGTDYQLRAIVDKIGLGALRTSVAIYPLAQTDRTLQTLTGAKSYVLHISAGQLPPVSGFWSLTMYDPNGFFVPNLVGRYMINDRSKLRRNSDGSIDLYVQHAAPSNPQQAQNWLPAPAGNFRLICGYTVPTPTRSRASSTGTAGPHPQSSHASRATVHH